MKTIIKIAKAELQVMFYSPIAWLILVIFAFQAGLVYTGNYDEFLRRVSLGWGLHSVTSSAFGGRTGLFSIVQSYLYLYIPLLTMGVMSRELSSGSIKLLYSSPITNYQIVFGKYLALVVYALAITGVLSVYSVHSLIAIENVEYSIIFTGLLGLFLVVCAYAAIGLFMSSFTSYTVVAAMGTLAVLALLNMVGTMWQDIEFVRNIAYWFSISGRADTFIRGMITSEDVLYFIIVITMFVSFSIIKLQIGRQKTSFFAVCAKYLVATAILLGAGFLSSLPQFKAYKDVTYSKINTLTKSSQEVMSKLDGPLTIHTYVNYLDQNYYWGLPYQYMQNMKLFENYTRFKPEIKFKTHNYYHKAKNDHLDERYPDLDDKQRIDTLIKLNDWKFPIASLEELNTDLDLASEKYRFVRVLERGDGQRTVLRIFDDMFVQPFESEISAAIKRMVMELPTVGFVTGHSERSSTSLQDRGYQMIAQERTFRHSLINQGFDFLDVSLNNPISDTVKILVIAEPRATYSPEQLANLEAYLEKGGNLILASDPESRAYASPIGDMLGVKFLPGILVKPSETLQPDLLTMRPTEPGREFSHHLQTMWRNKAVLTMPTASALEFEPSKGFEATTLFTSDSTGSWNELQTVNFIDDSVTRDLELEAEKPHATVMALSREVNGKTQKILVTGDADWLSNSELSMTRPDVWAANYSLISTAFYWLSDEEVPIDMRRAPAIDKTITTTKTSWPFAGFGLKWVFPIALILVGTLIWIRRRGR